MAGLTLDSGALIAHERADRRVVVHLKEALLRGVELTVPTAVVAEVWRGGPRAARSAMLLGACVVEPLSERLARAAGEALGVVEGSGVIDAIVMASAATRGDRVLTSDSADLRRLRTAFPNVNVVGI
ncbi:MAG: PIN domain-containing protein [Polyangiaceae bacterium]|nr:PIN domain-containing protein [Polyangiaceae bacterium]